MPSHMRHNYRSCIDVSTLKSEVETIRVDVVLVLHIIMNTKGTNVCPDCVLLHCVDVNTCSNTTKPETKPHLTDCPHPPPPSVHISQLGKSVQILLKMSESLTLHVRNCSMHYSDDVMYMKHTTLNQLVYMDVGISNIT